MDTVPPTVFNFSTSFERLGYNLTEPKTEKVAAKVAAFFYLYLSPQGMVH